MNKHISDREFTQQIRWKICRHHKSRTTLHRNVTLKKCETCAFSILFPVGNLEAIPNGRKALWLGRLIFPINLENTSDTSTAWHAPKQEPLSLSAGFLSGAHHILLSTWRFGQEQLFPPERSHWAERVWNQAWCQESCLFTICWSHVAISKATKSAIAFSLGALCSAALPQDIVSTQSRVNLNSKLKDSSQQYLIWCLSE